MVEGERVLHDLDTLSPADLFDHLVALGVAAAVQLLAAAPGAQLPAVAELAQKYYRCARMTRKAVPVFYDMVSSKLRPGWCCGSLVSCCRA